MNTVLLGLIIRSLCRRRHSKQARKIDPRRTLYYLYFFYLGSVEHSNVELAVAIF